MSEQKARRVNQERTSLATAVGGMNHWDWCPICRGGLDTGLECDQCGADLMPIYTALKESLSGGNPGEPNACAGAEERGIACATGAGRLPDGNPESTGDSADRRSPDGTARTPSPDESHRHHVSKSIVWMAKNRTYRETCYFGHYATAVAWANGGTVIPVEVFEPEAHDLRVTDGCAPDEPLQHQPISTAKEMTMETVDSTSDQRTVNNVMRHAYRVLSDAEKAQMQAIKDKGLEFWELIDSIGASRELSLAKTASEESVMWAVKHITK